MRRIGILTAGGDTPALNATIYGAVERANMLDLEIFGIMKGFSGILDDRIPHVHLNPLFTNYSRTRSLCWRDIVGSVADLCRTRISRDVLKRVTQTPVATRHRGPDLHWRRRHDQRYAAAF